MKYLVLALAGSVAMASPAFAQASSATGGAPAASVVTVGASVVDTKGQPVGTIESVSGANAVLSTGTAKAAIPVASFAKGPNGLVIGISKADLEAQVAQATKPTDITVGMAVSGPKGSPVGKVEAVSGDMVTVATATTRAQLPKAAFAKGQNGLVIGMTADQLNAAAAAKTPTEIAAGMAVSGPQGAPVGTVDSVAGDLITVATANTKVQLPNTAFAKGANGLVIGLSAEQLEAAAKAATPQSGGAGK
jgi:hypothetical protein